MKKKFLIMAFVSLLAASTFCACDKEEDINTSVISGNYEITVENGSSYSGQIESVRLTLGESDEHVICNVKYTNGKFTLNLPETVPDTYLEALDESGIPDGITISNSNLKIGYANLCAYKASNRVGSFYHSINDWQGRLVYMNGDVSITGTAIDRWDEDGTAYTDTFTHNIHMKKGWNIVYIREGKITDTDFTLEGTTETPSGVKWIYTRW
jgi:hypothetical protein